MLQKRVNCTSNRSRRIIVQKNFFFRSNVCYCSNIDGFFKALEYDQISIITMSGSCLLIQIKGNLMTVFLNNRNEKPIIFWCMHCTEKIKNAQNHKFFVRLKILLCLQLNISAYQKVINFLLGMQLSYIKHQCFLCFWNNRDDEQHYTVKDYFLYEACVLAKLNV